MGKLEFRWACLAMAGCALVLTSVPALTVLAAENAAVSYRDRLEKLRKERARTHARPESQAVTSDEKLPSRQPYIDEMVSASWKDNGLAPSENCTDGEFIRRATLDLVGRIPTHEEAKSFLETRSPKKREQLIHRLVESNQFGTHQANLWIKLLIPDDLTDPRDVNVPALYAWLEREFNRNRPWNEIVGELISATGRWDESPAVNFILANQDGPNSIRTTSMVTRLFLGVQTQCTECHNHPWNSWKQDQFHGMNAFFLGTRETRQTKAMAGQMMTDTWTLEEVPYQQVMAKGVFFERRNGLSVFVEPMYLDGKKVTPGPKDGTPAQEVEEYLRSEASKSAPIYLRQKLADFVTGDDNPYFARAMVNRVWYQLMGHSFTKNVDDFDNGLDEPTMPELLDKMAEDFRASGYDTKKLYEWVANSRAYGLSSRRKGKDANQGVGFFSFQLVRPLSPEQLYDSVLTVTGIDQASSSANASAERKNFIDEFRRTFGSDEIPTAAPTYDGTITQSLMLMNSWLMNRVCSCVPGSFLHSLITDESKNDRECTEAIYLAALSRKPTSNEEKRIAAMLSETKAPGERAEVFADVLWATINSAEFALNH